MTDFQSQFGAMAPGEQPDFTATEGAAIDLAADTLHLDVQDRLKLLQTADAEDRLLTLITLIELRNPFLPSAGAGQPFSQN